MYGKRFYPAFHITGEKGWINDPNGLVKFKGEYHVFFQYYPHDTKWGPMHWGHVRSRDLFHWELLPIALYPDGEDDGCFSGSAIVWRDKLWLMYTGIRENAGGETVRQVQCLASCEDGVNFQKHGVVIGEADLPADYCPWDFRDPKLFRRDGKFYCIVAARRQGAGGRLLLFVSDDLFRWQFCCDLFGVDADGTMTECPDFRDDMSLLMFSEVERPAQGAQFLNLSSCVCRFGEPDVQKGFVPASEEQILDYGFDFYAPQTFNGEAVMLAWMNMWGRSDPLARYGFSGQLTVARRLCREGGKLRQRPVYCGQERMRAENFSSLTDRLCVGAVRIETRNLRAFCIRLRKKGDTFASFSLIGGEWVFDRSAAGEPITGAEMDSDSLAGIRRMPYEKADRTQIEIVSDLYSLEIFVNGISLTSVICPEQDADGLELMLDADESTYVRFSMD